MCFSELRKLFEENFQKKIVLLKIIGQKEYFLPIIM